MVPRAGGPGCAIQDGKTGFLVAQDDELLARLRLLLHDRVLRHQFGAAARALALEPTDWSPLLNINRPPAALLPALAAR